MKRLLLILFVGLFVAAQGRAQSTDSSKTPPATASPELVEASKLSRQAVDLCDIKNYREALPLAKRALELREKVLGSEHELVAEALSNIAEIYIAEKKYAEAEPLYERCLSILERKRGPESSTLILTIERLALTRFALGDNGGAEKRYLRALEISEKSFGPKSFETSQSFEALAAFYDRTEKYKKAAELYERSVAVKEKLLDPNHVQFVSLLYKCACTLTQAGQGDKAKEYLERAQKSSPSTPVNQGQGALQGIALYRVQPSYPDDARRARIAGKVLVEVVVDECGGVISARSRDGHPELAPAAIKAAKQWRFSPTKIAGRPVKVIGTITFNFTL